MIFIEWGQSKMAGDAKSQYSESAGYYIDVEVPNNQLDYKRHTRSKQREEKYNEVWKKTKVNINDIVESFVPNHKIRTEGGIKLVFEDEKYRIKADKSAGYLRIYDIKKKRYVDLNGNPGSNEQTHFKIKKWEEME